MVFFKKIVVLFLVTLLFLILVLVSPSSTSSQPSSVQEQAEEIKTKAYNQMSAEDDHNQLFYIKNTAPMRTMKRMALISKRRKMMMIKSEMNTWRKKIKIKNSTTTTTSRPNFSVMLPKGYVPPSGSSPCHNESPNSVVFFCGAKKP